jgi:hypothetical protein
LVTAEARFVGEDIVAVPLTKDHLPVPVEGGLPDNVAVVALQIAWSTPAMEVVVLLSLITFTLPTIFLEQKLPSALIVYPKTV